MLRPEDKITPQNTKYIFRKAANKTLPTNGRTERRRLPRADTQLAEGG